MDKKLNNLKYAFDSTYFKGSTFKDSQKHYVLNNIKRSHFKENNKKPSFLFKKALSVGVISALTIGIGFFTFESLNNQEVKNTSVTSNKNETNSTNAAADNKQQQVAEEENNFLSKEQIHYLLLNSMDNFDTAQGNLEYKSKDQYEPNIEYQVDMDKINPIGFEKVGEVIKLAKDGEYKTIDAKTQKVVRNVGYSDYVEAKDEDKKIESRYSKSSDGKPLYNYRDDHPLVGISKGSLFPQELATNLLENYENWKIEDQNIKYLGRESIIIRGPLDKDNAAKFNSYSFKFWVDKQTGILLTYEMYDSEGNAVEYLRTKEIKINEKLDEEILNFK